MKTYTTHTQNVPTYHFIAKTKQTRETLQKKIKKYITQTKLAAVIEVEEMQSYRNSLEDLLIDMFKIPGYTKSFSTNPLTLLKVALILSATHLIK